MLSALLLAMGGAASACGSTTHANTGFRVSAANERPVTKARLRACGVPALTRGTRPPGSPILSDHVAACLVNKSPFEPRPQNARANRRIPTAAELTRFRALNQNPYKAHITGHYRGTTDEILQWAGWKWGFAPDVLRAVAVSESWWKQSWVGDHGASTGLMQLKRAFNPGTWPLITKSTAFNVDAYAATLRKYYDGGSTWLGANYRPGDLWGSIGAYFAAQWHTPAADHYARRVRGRVADEIWRTPGF